MFMFQRSSKRRSSPKTRRTNYQGLMVGEGSRNIWLEDFGDPGAGVPSRYQIITLSNNE